MSAPSEPSRGSTRPPAEAAGGPARSLPALARAFVPGAASQPEPLAQQRLMTGLTVIVVAILLQSLPLLLRDQSVLPALVRFSFWITQMLALAVALTAVYNHSQRQRSRTTRTLASTLVVSAILSLAFVSAYTTLTRAVPELRGDAPVRSVATSLAFGIGVGILHCGVWAFAFVFPYVAEDARHRALEADKLRLEAEQLKSAAELARLRSQLEPHFLLNTLNAIAGLVTENPREARRLIACLGDLLRDSLHDGDELQPLEAEVAWLRRYAEILESRHAGTLSFHWEIANGAKGALLPRLLLQPLVENAVKHGALRNRSGGVVTVRADVTDTGGSKKVICVVEDNGPGLAGQTPRAGAFGLHSVRRRLELKFPDAVLRMESSNSGTRSIVELPAAKMREAS